MRGLSAGSRLLSVVIPCIRAMSTGTGTPMLQLQRWAVVGDVLNPNKPASAVAERLRSVGKDVALVNPREKEGRCLTSLRECEPKPDVVDLIIHPGIGSRIIEEMKEIGIANVFIQPGAGSDAIKAACAEAQIAVHEGCVLREL